MFEKFSFTAGQTQGYLNTAIRDMKIADESDVPEVMFKFSYDALLKFAVALCARNGLRAKSRMGHHVALIGKLAEFLDNKEINTIGNEMRIKRNIDLYSGGTLISKKEAQEYCEWTKSVIEASKGKISRN